MLNTFHYRLEHDQWTRIERFHISHGFELMEASTEHAQYLNRQKWTRL